MTESEKISPPAKTGDVTLIRLRIEPVVQQAARIAEAVERDLPDHLGLVRAAHGVASAALEAERVSRRLRRLWGIHRLPVCFLALALGALACWAYWNFIHVTRLRIALPDRDAVQIHQSVAAKSRVFFSEVVVQGSREAAHLVSIGQVDLAFIQGGINFPPDLQRLETPRPELVLFFLRNEVERVSEMRRVLTSLSDEGSHSVARDFLAIWGIERQVEFVHHWAQLSGESDYEIPAEIDAVFVVKDPSSEKTSRAVNRLANAGFRLVEPSLGGRALQLDYLRPAEVPAGYLRPEPQVPSQAVATYSVKTFLVARRGLTPRLLALAGHLLDPPPPMIADAAVEIDFKDAGEALQGIDAFLSILVYMGLAFLTLMGFEIMTYRPRFNELNSLISLISVHQSSKDVLGVKDPHLKSHNLLYLSTCSDLLGLIGVIAGYYSQENASLLYNNLLSVVYDRADSLRLNIQLKILHAAVPTPVGVSLSPLDDRDLGKPVEQA